MSAEVDKPGMNKEQGIYRRAGGRLERERGVG